jgi:hypothetical protein
MAPKGKKKPGSVTPAVKREEVASGGDDSSLEVVVG